jgi:hypothetical protein
MVAIVATCDLRDVNIHGQTNPEPFLNLLSALTDLYQEHASTASGGGGRAQKRRKLDDGASVESQSSDAFDGSKSVVLAKVSFHLVSMNDYFYMVRPYDFAAFSGRCTKSA